MSDWALIYQAIAAGSAAVSAVTSALQYAKTSKKPLTRNDLFKIARQAQMSVEKDVDTAKEAAEQVKTEIDERTESVIGEIIKRADKKWGDDMLGTNDPADWARVTDERRASICAALRVIKGKCGGVLPSHWYKVWADNQCS